MSSKDQKFYKLFNSKHIFSLLAIGIFSCVSLLLLSSSSVFSSNAPEAPTQIPDPAQINSTQPITYGILLPIEHASLKEIVDGFKSEVRKRQPSAVFNIQNAQGDIKLQRSIIEQFVGQKVNVIVPIGTTATQMTLSYVKDIPVVSLAADLSEDDRNKQNPRNFTGVLDEIGAVKKLDFIKQVYPNLKKLTVIFHSGNEKNFKEIDELTAYGKTLNIEVQQLSIHTLPELETAAAAIDKDSEAVLILKDHLVVSGIRLLIPIAADKHIPLISSDEGSVQEGASFALGIQERSIGETGGNLAVEIIDGKPVEDIPLETVSDLVVFYNQAVFKQQNLTVLLKQLRTIAKQDGYPLISK